MRVLSGSQIERGMLCVASTALPQVKRTSEAAERGTAIHNFISGCFELRDGSRALISIPERYKLECQSIDVGSLFDTLASDKVLSEVPFCIDTVRSACLALPRSGHRNYPESKPGEIYVTIDLGSVKDDKGKLIEIKTGKEVASARINWQLQTQAYALAVAFDLSNVDASIAYLQDDGSFTFDSTVFDAIDLDRIGEDLKQLAQRRQAAIEQYEKHGTVDASEGEHCRYCPSMHACPAKIGLVQAMSLEISELSIDAINKRMRMLTPEQRGEAWDKLMRFEPLFEAMKESLASFAREEPLPLPNGKLLKEVSQSREFINGPRALPILVRTLGSEVADKCISFSTSKSAIEKAAPKGKAQEVIDELRREGVIVTKSFKQLKAV